MKRAPQLVVLLLMISSLSFSSLFISTINAQDDNPDYHREVEVGVSDDYVEILSYNYTETNQTSRDTELEISFSTEGKEGPIIVTFDYESEVSSGGSSTETALSFTLVYDRLIEYHDDNADGKYEPGIDSQIKSVSLGDRGFEMYSVPEVNTLTLDGKNGWQIIINGSIPVDGSDFEFNLISYVFEDPVQLNGLDVSSTEIKTDIEILNFPFDSTENDLSLRMILTSEFETSERTDDSESYIWVENNLLSGYFGWLNYAMVDGIEKPVTSYSNKVDEETRIFLSYTNGAKIIHDPSLGIPQGSTFIPPLIRWWIYVIIGVGVVALSVSILMMTKTEFRSYLLNRKMYYNQSVHKLSMEEVLDNENRSKIIDIIIDNPGIHYKELLRMTDTSPSNLAWHLDILENYKIIKKKREGHFLIFFTILDKNPFSDFDVSIAKSEVTLQIYQYLLDNPGKYLNQISSNTKIHYKTVKYHLDKLIDANMVYTENKKKGRITTLYYSRDLDLDL